jgi:hypothetical protein
MPKEGQTDACSEIGHAMPRNSLGQVKSLASSDLTDPENGVKSLLAALSSWEESTEMKTYEQFEKAVYRTVQKTDCKWPWMSLVPRA